MNKKIGLCLFVLAIAFIFSGLYSCGGGGGGGTSESGITGGSPGGTGGGGSAPPPQVTSVEYFGTYYKEKTATLTANIPTATIIIDGDVNDWAGISPFISDEPNNKWTGDYSLSGTDITNVYLAKDDNYLYCRIDIADGAPNQSVQYRIYLPEKYEDNKTNWVLPYLVIQGVFNNNKWVTELRFWDGTNWRLENTDLAAINSSGIEMRMQLSSLGNPDRRYVQAMTRSFPTGYKITHDVTDTLEARFTDISNKSVRESGFGIWTFYSDGNWTFSGSGGSNDKGGNIPITASGKYNKNPDGMVSISGSGWDGWKFGMQKGSGTIIGASLDQANNVQGICALYKKGGVHTLVDSKTYFTTFIKDNAYRQCFLGISELKATGEISSQFTYNMPSGIGTSSVNGTYSRNSDGSGKNKFESSVGSIGVFDSSGNAVNTKTKTITVVYDGATREDEKFTSNVQLNNQYRNRQRISFSFKRPENPLNKSILNGEYFACYYEENNNNERKSGFGTMNYDGAGNLYVSLTVLKSDGTIESGPFNGTYDVDNEGKIEYGGNAGPLTGYVNEEGDTIIAANITDATRQYIILGVKAK